MLIRQDRPREIVFCVDSTAARITLTLACVARMPWPSACTTECRVHQALVSFLAAVQPWITCLVLCYTRQLQPTANASAGSGWLLGG